MAELKQQLLDIAQECLGKGPGYAQEGVVLREAAERLGLYGDLQKEQELLRAWHDLFRDGSLSWGYSVDNPDSPFFHKPRSASAHAGSR
jgi:hypothetical protein